MLPDWLSDIRYRVRAIIGRDRLETDLDAEMRFHLDTETDRLVRDGLSAAEAGRRARMAFGGIEQVKEETRDSRGVRMFELISRDLAHAFRLAVKRPVFSAIVALSLALGVGATTAVFNLTYNLLFAPLAVPHPEQLVSVMRSDQDGPDNAFSWNESRALVARPGIGTYVTVRSASAISIAAGERRELINMHFVSGGYLPLIGLAPAEGRLINQRDDDIGAPVVVLAGWFARRLFPGDSAVAGRTVLIRGVPFTVIGVMPRAFHGLEFPAWFTAAIPEGATQLLGPGRDNRGEPYGAGDSRRGDERTFRIVGRVAGDARAAQAALAFTLQHCCASTASHQSLELINARHGIQGGKNDVRPQARMITAILLAAMTLVLVVVCCNIASLLLVRTSARRREIAVRLSLGASRARLVCQLVIENLPQALLGGAGSLLVAAWCTGLLVRGIPDGIVPAVDLGDMLRFRPGPMLGFTAAITVACAIAFAIYPALRATRQPLAQALRLDSRASRTRRQTVVARAAVIAQVAVTLMLVTAAGLFTATLGNLAHTTGGFATRQLLLAGIEARSTPYEQTGVEPLVNEIVRRVRAVPGVQAAAMSSQFPLVGGINWSVNVEIPGRDQAQSRPSTRVVAAVPGYFDAAGIRLASGRDFTAAEQPGSQPVAIVNRAFARRYLPGVDPIGRSVGIALRGDTVSSVTVVGVASDVTYDDLRDAPAPFLYLPWSQSPTVSHGGQLVVRTSGDPLRAASAIRHAVDLAAPGINVLRVTDMNTVRATATALLRMGAGLAAFVSGMALLLSVIGLYGVVAYSVSRRTSEIGVRLALGARNSAVLWLVAQETIALVGLGVLAGIPLSFAANGAVRTQLFGVGPHDPAAAIGAVALLAVAGAAASLVPARRATRIDPRIALNAD